MRPGPFFSVSDASVAYNARDRVWIISWLGAHFSGGGIVDVMASRSVDGGLTWTAPVTIATRTGRPATTLRSASSTATATPNSTTPAAATWN